MNNNQPKKFISNNANIHQFPNIGILSSVFTDKELAPLKEEILEIQNNFDLSDKWNSKLAGNIRKEFVITKSISHISKLLEPYVLQYEKSCGYIKSVNVLDTDCLSSIDISTLEILSIDKIWVNFQEKYEFNPIHSHSGVLSFVIWIDIPYDISDEVSQSPGAQSNSPLAGHFTFHYTNILGKITPYNIDVDRSMNNRFLIFPATLQHSVAPFYSSDNYRISVSGNYSFQVPAYKAG